MYSEYKWVNFRNKQLLKLIELRKKLLEKYNSEQHVKRIDYLFELLTMKLQYLNEESLLDYIRLIILCSKEYEEFKELIPSSEELDNLLLVI